MLQVFDLPDMSQSFGARYVSTVPTQALQLMNDDFVLNQAQLFADRVKKEAGDDIAKQVDLAYRIALTRPPTQQGAFIGDRHDLIGFACRLHERHAQS